MQRICQIDNRKYRGDIIDNRKCRGDIRWKIENVEEILDRKQNMKIGRINVLANYQKI